MVVSYVRKGSISSEGFSNNLLNSISSLYHDRYLISSLAPNIGFLSETSRYHRTQRGRPNGYKTDPVVLGQHL